MILTEKQRQVWRESIFEPRRWNISVGAVRSGKTYLDYFRIPYRVCHADKWGIIVLAGFTEGTLERNILAPMREMFGEKVVGRLGKGGKVRICGRECYAVGAYRSGMAERLRGASVSYCYGDEVTSWSEDFFIMLMSRLDRPGAVFDGSCNPASPFHWFKRFIDREEKEGGSIRVSRFTIDDNTALTEEFRENLKREYAGSVFYDRYILGLWKSAEGAVYGEFANAPERFVIGSGKIKASDIIMADIGVDFGGNGSATAFNLTGYTAGYEKIITLDEFYRKGVMSPKELEREFVSFARRAVKKYPRVCDVYCDSAEQVLIRGLENAVRKAGLPVMLHNARKGDINQRIRFYNAIMGRGKYFICSHCENTIRAFGEAVWEKNTSGIDRRLDNGSVNIDSLDAQEYSTEKRMREIMERS
ncbi:MAG: PBSX family phage terminase large subunit [Oscillospiraceae bacterium]|nr:PBSX family phage terminase large subunit [Oscillospiraceae bacterium]